MEGLRRVGIEDVGDNLHFEIMVARTERTHLPALTLLGPFGDALGFCILLHALFLDALEIVRLAPSALDRPARAARQHSWRPFRLAPA